MRIFFVVLSRFADYFWCEEKFCIVLLNILPLKRIIWLLFYDEHVLISGINIKRLTQRGMHVLIRPVDLSSLGEDIIVNDYTPS